MAKKKHAKAAKKEAPAKSESNSMGWIIAAIVVVVIIAFLVMKGGKVTETVEKTKPAVAEKTTLTTSVAPEFALKCLNAMGVVPGTISVKEGIMSATFKNNGRTGIEGTYFEFVDAAGKAVYKKNSDAVAAGATIAYTVDVNQVASELGSSVKTLVLYPVEGGKACKNQRRVVIPDLSKVSA